MSELEIDILQHELGCQRNLANKSILRIEVLDALVDAQRNTINSLSAELGRIKRKIKKAKQP